MSWEMDWSGKRVAVTGSAGVIGRRLVNLLAANGARVWSLDLKPLPPEVNAAAITHYKMDLADMPDKILADFSPEIVFHLAASFERSAESPEFWEENCRNNLLASHRVIEAGRQCKDLQRFVFASSYLIYAPHLYIARSDGSIGRLREDDPIGPRNLCGCAKLYAEGELQFTARTGGYASTFARIYRVFGRGSRDVISRWVRAALAGESIEVYGPEGQFDYIFADDVAEGLCRLAMAERCLGPVNLSYGESRRIGDVVAALLRLFPQLRVRYAADQIPIERSEGDIRRLIDGTGWKPAIQLEEGIRLIVDYESARCTSAALRDRSLQECSH